MKKIDVPAMGWTSSHLVLLMLVTHLMNLVCATGQHAPQNRCRDDLPHLVGVVSRVMEWLITIWNYVTIIVFLCVATWAFLALADFLLDESWRDYYSSEHLSRRESQPRSYRPRRDSSTQTDSFMLDKPSHDRYSGKSSSWNAADLNLKTKSATIGPGKPTQVHYYYGKLVQITSSTQVQVGDHNVSTGVDAAGAACADQDCCSDRLFCQNCRCVIQETEESSAEIIIRDEKEEKIVTDSVERGESMESSFDSTTPQGGADCSEEEEQPETPEHGSPNTCSLNESDREQLFVEARIKILNATREYRDKASSSPELNRGGGVRKSIKKLFKKKS